MINVFLLNGDAKSLQDGGTLFDLASSISSSFAQRCLVAKVDGKLKDMSSKAQDGTRVEFILNDKETPEALEIVRHSTAHLMACAIKELFPFSQIVIGPVIENGFYYDIKIDKPLVPDDLAKIENKMHEIVSRNDTITRKILPKQQAMDFFNKEKEEFKVRLLNEMNSDEQEISLYKMGTFTDLCRGPHVPNTGILKHFKLTKFSGSYWRGNSEGESLQRVYGTAWIKKSSLDNYLAQIKEAEKRDHRKLGKDLDLFHQCPMAPGDVFWHPKGYSIFLALQSYIREAIKDAYKEVKTPILMKRELWESSGHWEKYSENMFTLKAEDEDFAIKPMNCPAHVQIFKNELKSYRDLPIRLAEFGCCHRFEPSGALHGLMRVRSFIQDDAHIFCTKSQIKDETIEFIKLLTKVYNELGFDKIKIKFSDRPEKRIGSDKVWDMAENALKSAIESTKNEYILNKGEGAFYGPKLEFVLTDAIGRDWQCGTIQVDMVLPERLGATFINEDGKKEYPVMLHRAILGSIERFIGILIENYSGKLPLWLAPIQVVVCSLSDEFKTNAEQLKEELCNLGIKAECNTSNETVNYKVRLHSEQKVPYILIVGKKEVEEGTVSVRELGQSTTKVENKSTFIAELQSKIADKK